MIKTGKLYFSDFLFYSGMCFELHAGLRIHAFSTLKAKEERTGFLSLGKVDVSWKMS